MADKKNNAADVDDDLDGLQLAINEKSDETLDCTRRMREMCAEAKDSGMKTLIALDDQEELIDKFEAAADGINADMALAEKALKVGCANQGSTQDKSCRCIMDCCLLLLHLPDISTRTSSFLPFFLYVCFVLKYFYKIDSFDIKDYQIVFLYFLKLISLSATF